MTMYWIKSNDWHLQVPSTSIYVDRSCGAAIMRGADIYAQGVLASNGRTLHLICISHSAFQSSTVTKPSPFSWTRVLPFYEAAVARQARAMPLSTLALDALCCDEMRSLKG